MPASDVKICSRALVMVGAEPIATLNGPSTEQVACKTLWPAVVGDLLSRYRWRFASRIVPLQRLLDKPLARYDAAYQIPSEAQESEIYAVLHNDEPIEFERFERNIYCDVGPESTIYAEVMIVPNVVYWPRYFVAIVEYELAARLAISIAESPERATFYEGKSLRALAHGKTLDAQTRTARKMPTGGLRRWHRGRP